MNRRLLLMIFFGGLANLILFIGVASYLGGDALNGREAAGRFYLGSHGRFIEVSRAVFTYSWWHTVSVFITQPIALLAAWCATRGEQVSKD